jgi:serine/threonine protein kinase/Flp pilus assembly protein TadD
MHVPSSGDTLSRFRLVEKIGEGGMGEVWKARDTSLDRDVALKILPAELTQDPVRLAAFEGEAKAVAALSHPNIVTIHSVENVGGVHFIAMELVRGRQLSKLIPPAGFSIDEFLELAIPIADAVRAAHEKDVIHRDLKPANVMIGEESRVKVLDFGLAQIRGTDTGLDPSEIPTRTLTTGSEIRGTLPYMSPEQLQDKPLDQRSDVFSLGIVFYEMATGRIPFDEETAVELIAAILRDYPRPVTELNRGLPDELQRIIAHSMQKDRGRRLQSALELRNRLEALKSEIETAPLPRGTVESAQTGSDLTSVAVLPLENHATDSSQDFFSDGMTEALITGLAKIEGLRVISRTSVMRYKGASKPLKEIASELGVGAIVEGSVLRAEDRVRITAQLIDARTDEHIWAESYERQIQDLFALQSEVAHAIACQVRVKLTAQDEQRLGDQRTINPEAHEAYLKGRHFWYKRTPASVQKGLEFFEEAARIDPDFAPAWAGIADSYIVDGGGYLGIPSEEAYRKAKEAALKAVRLDEQLAEAHTSLAGVVTDYDWDWTTGESAFRRAIELNPNYVTARYWYADYLTRLGRVEESIRQAKRALEVDPLSLTTNFMLSWIYFFARRYDDAIEQARKTIELGPRFVPGYRVLGWAYEEKGELDRALEAHHEAAELSDNHVDFRAQLGRPHALAGRKDEARKILAELTARAESESVAALDLATLHAALGDVPSALAWLTRACDQHDDHVPYIKVNPRLDSLRSEPVFRDLLRRVGLSD